MSVPSQTPDLVVRGLCATSVTGTLQCGTLMFPCALGRSGRGHRKREGDGITPIGRWPLRKIYFRADKRGPLRHPPGHAVGIARPTKRSDGWCDGVGDGNYNRPVTHPYPTSAEHLWRDDALYDLVIVLGHNDRPRVQGGGSAIFVHIADQSCDGRLKPTAGCVALRARDLRTVLSKISARTHMRILG